MRVTRMVGYVEESIRATSEAGAEGAIRKASVEDGLGVECARAGVDGRVAGTRSRHHVAWHLR
jgi:hypothetical protein